MNNSTTPNTNTNNSPSRQEQLASLMRTLSKQLMRNSGKHPGKTRILRMLCQDGSLTQQEIQSRLDIQSGSVSEILSKMETLGLISRERHSKDRRKFVISITTAGRKDLVEHDIRRHKRQDARYGSLTPEEQDELIRLLSKLQEAWKSLPANPAENPAADKKGESVV